MYHNIYDTIFILFETLHLTLSLPQMTKTEFLLTISNTQAGDENREEYQLWDYKLIQYQILWTNNIKLYGR